MPRIDVECNACAHQFEYMRMLSEYPNVPPCEKCQSTDTAQFHPQPRVTWRADPVVVFRAPDGTFRFPGDAGGTSAGRYAAQGYERVEIRGAQEMRRFESAMSKHEYSRMSRRVERKQQLREERESFMRSELRHRMKHFSELGKNLGRAAMTRNDHKGREYAGQPGFHSEVYSYDRSNREAGRDAQGRRRRD